MKTLLISGIYPPDIGGPSTFIPGLRQHLIAKDIKVRVVTLTDNLSASKKNHPEVEFVSRKKKFPFRQISTLVLILRNMIGVNLIFSNGLFEETAIASALLRKDVIFKIVGDPVWERYRNRSGSRVTIEEFNYSNKGLRTKFQRVILRISLNRGKHICTPSNQLAELIEKWGVTTPITVIPNGVPRIDVSRPNPVKYDVVTVSRLVSWKNIDSIVRACAIKSLKLAIVGDGPERAELEELAEKIGADVTFLGSLEGGALQNVLSESKVFCLYSDYEGLSFALISALMIGMFVVVSDIPGNRNAIKGEFNGILVPLRNIESLADEIAKGTINSTKNEKIRINAARHAIENYLDTNCYDKTLQLMEHRAH